MARRGGEADAETAEIVGQGSENVGIGLAGIAARGADLAQGEGPAVEAVVALRSACSGKGLFRRDDQCLTLEGGNAVVAAEGYGFLGADIAAGAAEQAAPHVELGAAFRAGRDGPGGADVGAGRAVPAVHGA